MNLQSLDLLWRRYRKPLLLTAVVLTAMAAVWRVPNELQYLLFRDDNSAAIDLRARFDETRAWFSAPAFYDEGEPDEEGGFDYPPASYLMFWPLLGWLPFTAVRVLWAAACLGAAAGIAWISVRATRPRNPGAALLLALIPFGGYALGATLRVGQISFLVLVLLLIALDLLHRRPKSLGRDLAVGVLLLAALIKPTLGAPFVLMAMLLPGGFLPAVVCILGYGFLYAAAAAFRPESIFTLTRQWLGATSPIETYYLGGQTNIYRWLVLAGLDSWIVPAMVLMLLALLTWTLAHRRADFWTLMGAGAIVTRFLTYHRLYDDALIFLTLIPLFRFASRAEPSGGLSRAAALLFFLNWAALLAPGSIINEPGPLRPVAEAAQAVIWLATLGFLLVCARKKSSVS